MATLIVARTEARARKVFDLSGLRLTDGDMPVGLRGELYGNRFDRIIFIDTFEMNEKAWEWITRGVLCRLAPGGEIEWVPQ